MTTSEFKQSQIALACWRASPGERHTVMLAVCQVFMNRAKAGWFQSDLYENAWRWLFENNGGFPDTRDPEFQQLLAKIDSVTSGLVSDKTDGAIHFVSQDKLVDNPAAQIKITTRIGNLVFFK